MSPTTKESQRAELHKTIWRIANDLRGSVDGWDFKTYVLGMLFYRFISENLTAYLNKAEHKAGDASFDYARLPDAQAEFGRKETVEEKGFTFFLRISSRTFGVTPPLILTSTRRWSGSSKILKGQRSARKAKATSRACSTTLT